MVSFQLAGNEDSIPPFPPEHHGITWRVLTEDDLHALGALIARMEARDNPPYRTALAEVAEMLSLPMERNRRYSNEMYGVGTHVSLRPDTIARLCTH